MRVIFAFAFVIFWMEGRVPKKILYEILWILWIDDFLLWIDELMKKWGSLDNWQSLRPITLWGRVKNQNWLIIKADNEYKETQSKQLFPPSGEAVLSPRHDLWAMFYDHARLLCTNSGARTFIGWKKLGHNLARILLECTLHTFANCICICTHLQIVFAFCLSISFAPMTHFLLKFANQKL